MQGALPSGASPGRRTPRLRRSRPRSRNRADEVPDADSLNGRSSGATGYAHEVVERVERPVHRRESDTRASSRTRPMMSAFSASTRRSSHDRSAPWLRSRPCGRTSTTIRPASMGAPSPAQPGPSSGATAESDGASSPRRRASPCPAGSGPSSRGGARRPHGPGADAATGICRRLTAGHDHPVPPGQHTGNHPVVVLIGLRDEIQQIGRRLVRRGQAPVPGRLHVGDRGLRDLLRVATGHGTGDRPQLTRLAQLRRVAHRVRSGRHLLDQLVQVRRPPTFASTPRRWSSAATVIGSHCARRPHRARARVSGPGSAPLTVDQAPVALQGNGADAVPQHSHPAHLRQPFAHHRRAGHPAAQQPGAPPGQGSRRTPAARPRRP
ncbi:hypothetical protein GA0115254_121014 [Streptomyces sp. Ncost-T10-10d]|nr:hypothetical protein GA0115254_121014 [Streptomyces sp. Ncost-T10-10d]